LTSLAASSVSDEGIGRSVPPRLLAKATTEMSLNEVVQPVVNSRLKEMDRAGRIVTPISASNRSTSRGCSPSVRRRTTRRTPSTDCS
jgi:hypothetical protein